MNQQYQPMAPYGRPRPAVRPWLWIIFVIVLLAGAGVYWYYYYGPGKTTQATTTPATTDETANWNTFKSDTFGYTIKYPKDWEYKTESANTTFAPKTTTEDFLLGVYVKTDKLNTIIAQQKEQFSKNNTFSNQTTTKIGGTDATKLSFVNSSDKTITPVVYLVEKNNYVYVITGEGAAGKYNDIVKKMIGTFKFTTPTTATSTSTDLTYTNTDYGFTLTFPAAWKGYKFKEASLEGITMTYYVEVPTTDKNATGDSTADAGYYSPFAIGVYTLAQWAVVEASEGPHDTLITKNDQYAFGWSQANGVPPSDFTQAMRDQIKTIIDSFKLS